MEFEDTVALIYLYLFQQKDSYRKKYLFPYVTERILSKEQFNFHLHLIDLIKK